MSKRHIKLSLPVTTNSRCFAETQNPTPPSPKEATTGKETVCTVGSFLAREQKKTEITMQ